MVYRAHTLFFPSSSSLSASHLWNLESFCSGLVSKKSGFRISSFMRRLGKCHPKKSEMRSVLIIPPRGSFLLGCIRPIHHSMSRAHGAAAAWCWCRLYHAVPSHDPLHLWPLLGKKKRMPSLSDPGHRRLRPTSARISSEPTLPVRRCLPTATATLLSDASVTFLEVKKTKIIPPAFQYHRVVSYILVNNLGASWKLNLYIRLRYGHPDVHFWQPWIMNL